MGRSVLALLLTCVSTSVGAQSAPLADPLQAVVLFDRARAALPCSDIVRALMIEAGLREMPEQIEHDFALRGYSDAARGLDFALSAETTPLGLQFVVSLTMTGTDAQFRDELEQGFRFANQLPAARPMPELSAPQAAGWRHDFANGTTVVVIEHQPMKHATSIYAALEPTKRGASNGC